MKGLKPHQTDPIKVIFWLGGIAIAWAWAHLISPQETIASAGLGGWKTESFPIFNWELFLKIALFTSLAVPLLSLLSAQWLAMILESALIAGVAGLAWNLAQNHLQTEVELSGIQGWKERLEGYLGFEQNMQKQFLTGPLLVTIAGAFSLWLLVRVAAREAIANRVRTREGLLKIMVALAAGTAIICYCMGLHTPLFHSTRFWVMNEEISLADSAFLFFKTGEKFIGWIIITFTFVFPLIKFIALAWGLTSGTKAKVNNWLSALGKWSMLDVFVVAVLLLNMKLDSGLLDMELRQGVIWFSISILLTLVASALLTYSVKQSGALSDETA